MRICSVKTMNLPYYQLVILGLVAGIGLAGCEGSSSVSNLEPGEQQQTESSSSTSTPTPEESLAPAFKESSVAEHVAVNTSSAGRAPLAPEDVGDTRARRRLDIDQLNASIQRVTGGIKWTEMRGSTEVDLFEDLSLTLGKPDFLDSTQEDLSPSLIFMKFLNDASRQVCDKLSAKEVADYKLLHNNRHLYVDIEPGSTESADIDANITSLLMNFHGTDAPVGSPEHKQWRWLFDSSMHVANDTQVAWRTVCVGLLTHPDFYTY